MPPEQVDWTFDDIPAEPPAPALGGPTPPPSPTDKPHKLQRPLPRWLIPATLVVGLLLVVGGYVFQRIGWARIEAQLQAEVALEDRYSRAGQVDLVLPLLAHDNDLWFRARLWEITLGLPAPLPAPQLLPLPDEPRVLKVDALSGDLFAVTVLRRYADPAGQAVEFEQVQTYRSLGPGLWQHVSSVVDMDRPTSIFGGKRLIANYPAVDAKWLQVALPQVDANLVEACVDWDCPADALVPLSFYTDFASAPRLPDWRLSAPGPLPLIFDLAPLPPTYPPSLKVPALALVGRPHDAPAAALLVRTLTVQGLAFIAAALSRSDRTAGDYYLDALVARAEQRLGLAAPLPPGMLPEQAAWPPGLLWNPTPGDFNSYMADEHTERTLALQFLNTALAGQPASMDGLLLRSLRQRDEGGPVDPRPALLGLRPWLEATLGRAATAQAYARWAGVLEAASLTPVAPSLGTLLLTCNDGAWLVNGGDAVIVPSAAFTQPTADTKALSPDGRYFAYLDTGSQLRMHVLDLETGEDDPVAIDPNTHLAGWSADNQLLFVSGDRGHVARYDPVAHVSAVLLATPVDAWQLAWTRDHRSLLLLWYEDKDMRIPPSLSRLDVVGTSGLFPLMPGVSKFALSPDDSRVAYVTWESSPSGAARWRIDTLDLATGAPRTVLTEAQVVAQLEPDHALGAVELGALAWSPDGRQLILLVSSAERQSYLYTVTIARPESLRLLADSNVGLLLSSGFSADGRFLAYRTVNLDATVNGIFSTVINVVDLTTGEQQTVSDDKDLNNAAWSPTGHTLALAGRRGVFLQDVTATTQTQIARQSCGGVQWYAPPAAPMAGD